MRSLILLPFFLISTLALAKPQANSVLITVDKRTKTLEMYYHGKLKLRTQANIGKPDYPTPNGCAVVLRTELNHHSNVYSRTSATHFVYLAFHGNYAGITINSGHGSFGEARTHGSIVVDLDSATKIFNAVNYVGPQNTLVCVNGESI